ncbi:hypothetical protein [Microcystis phage Mel-JY01]
MIQKEMLLKYIQHVTGLQPENIDIKHYDIDGATCSVMYYTNDGDVFGQDLQINIWDMVMFLFSTYTYR